MNLVHMSVSGAAMIMITAAIRALLLHRLPKRAFLVLWGIILVRLLVPYSLPCSLSAYSLLAQSGAAEKTAESIDVPIMPEFSTDASYGDVPASRIRTAVWIAGILLCAVFFTMSYLRCLKRFRESLPVDNDFTKQWLAEHRLFRRISVRCSDRIEIPLTYGIFRPVILLPKKFGQLDVRDLKFVLTHEYVHIRRFDAAFKLVLISALCVHWFNPLVWVMYIIANRDIELSCDKDVLRMLGESEKEAYAMSMIRMEESKIGLYPLINHFGKNAVKERIIAIMKFRKTTALTIAAAVSLIVGTTTVFATTAETHTGDLVQQTNISDAPTAQIKTTDDTLTSMTGSDILPAVETNDDTKTLIDTTPAETVKNSDGEEISEAEMIIALEPGMGIPIPSDGNYIIHEDIDENGNRIVSYFPVEGELTHVPKSKDYTNEEIGSDGIIRW